MIGLAYNRYFPKEVFMLPSGLAIYQSVFKNASGGYGVVGGTHALFTEIEKWHGINYHEFVSSQLRIFHCGAPINPDISLLRYKSIYEDQFNHFPEKHNIINFNNDDSSDNSTDADSDCSLDSDSDDPPHNFNNILHNSHITMIFTYLLKSQLKLALLA